MKRFFTYFFALLLVVSIVLFAFKNKIAAYFIEKEKSKIEERYGIQLTYKAISLSGFSNMEVSEVLLIPNNCDTLIHCPLINLNYDFWALLKKQIVINDLQFNSIDINIVKTKKCNNLAFLFSRSKSDSVDASETKLTLENLFRKSSKALFNILPENFNSKEINLKLKTDSIQESLSINDLKIADNKITGEIKENRKKESYTVNGNFIKQEKYLELKITNPQRQSLDFVSLVTGVYSNFDEFSFRFLVPESDSAKLNTIFEVKNLSCFHKRIAADTVYIDSLKLNFNTFILNNDCVIDSTSTFNVNKINTNVYLLTNYKKPRIYELKLNIKDSDAKDFFPSLPKAMFSNFEDFAATGIINYKLQFSLNESNPDSCIFYSDLDADNLVISNYGKGNINKLNGPFMHYVYENDRLVKTIDVSPANPEYFGLTYISPFLKNAILTSEDGSFFWHKGFNEDAFRKSIVENYKAGKFVRGGSTISMQLIKNVFLNRKKNVARKLEEVLIVWLIENKRLTSKEKMLEVYLNIIEFGPDVYGIGPASKYYFNKKPIMLTLSESIFLSSILPRPKYFKYNFDEYGRLRPFLADYYRVVANFLKHKNLITENEYNDLKPSIDVVGEARKLLHQNDSIPDDFIERSLKVE